MHTYKCTHSTIVRVDFSLAWTLSRIVHPFVTETWHYSLHFPTFPTRQEGLLSPDFNSKPGWNQNYFFPKEKFSFSGWDSAKHLCVPSCFSGPKAIGPAARLFKPLVSLASFSPFHSATMQEAWASKNILKVEGCCPFSGQRAALQEATSEEPVRDGMDREKFLAGMLIPAFQMVAMAEVTGDLFAMGNL